MTNRRRKYLIDAKVQGALIGRLLVHWLAFFLIVFLVLPLWGSMFTRLVSDGAPQPVSSAWTGCGPMLLVMLVLLPLFVWDTVKLSNRFVGPMVRLRRAMHALANGENPTPVNFRQGDYWADIAESYNTVRARLEELERNNAPAAAVCGSDAPASALPIEAVPGVPLAEAAV
jgi:hypothetical protein